MTRTIPAALLTTGIAVIAAGGAFAATHAAAGSQAATTTTSAGAAKTTTAAKKSTPAKKTTSVATHKYVGPGVDMQWGTVQVTIVVKGNVVTDLSATAPTERARSAFINQQAIPMLRQEVLQAKTAANIKNIYGISGATMTSEAFYQSLLSALHQAKLL